MIENTRIQRWDKVVYDYFMDGFETKFISESDRFEVLNFLYRGVKPEDDSVAAQICSATYVAMVQRTTKNNILKASSIAKAFLSQIDKELKKKDDERRQQNKSIAKDGDDFQDEGLDSNEIDALCKEIASSDDTKDAVMDAVKTVKDIQDLLGDEMENGGGSGQDQEDCCPEGMSTAPGRESGKAGNLNKTAIQQFESLLKNNPSIKKILSWFGTFMAHISYLKRIERLPNRAARTNIITGNHINSLLPSNLALMDPEFSDLFDYKYAKNSLLQFDPFKEDPVGKGDMTFLVDISGSMGSRCSFEDANPIRIHLIGGLLLAMMKSLYDDGRHSKVFLFDNEVFFGCDTRKMGYQKSVFNVLHVLRPRGGTDIELALNLAWDNYPEDDLVVLSDLEFFPSFNNFDLVKEKKGDDNRLFGMTVDVGYSYYKINQRKQNHFSQLCENYVVADSIQSLKDFSRCVL